VYGDGLQVRDWLFVEDHARALALVVERGEPGQSYVVGGRDERPNRDVLAALCAELDRARPAGAPHARLLTRVTDRPGHDRRYAVDPSKIERELGFAPRVTFAEGLRLTVEWNLARH
jgi:dTDP-glucose 4,6-dehydratase